LQLPTQEPALSAYGDGTAIARRHPGQLHAEHPNSLFFGALIPDPSYDLCPDNPDPAVTIGRIFSDNFTGITPDSAPC
jgi:hypothetical protein